MNIKTQNKKILKLNESVNLKPTAAEVISAVEVFIAEFPDNATSWIDATQEIGDIARWLEDVAVTKIPNTKSYTPSEYNIKFKTYIRQALTEIDEHYMDMFYEYYKHWFFKSLNENDESIVDDDTKDLKELTLSKSKQFTLDNGLFFETINSGKLETNRLSLKYHQINAFDADSFVESVRTVVTFAELYLTENDIERLKAHYEKYT